MRIKQGLIVTTDEPVAPEPGAQPRTDLTELARCLPGEVRHVSKTLAGFGGLAGKIGLAWKAFWLGARGGDASAILSSSEIIGLPLAAGLLVARRKTPHVMVAHKLHTPARLRLLESGILTRRVAHIVVVSQSQAALLRAHLPKAQQHKLVFVPRYVDDQFFRPPASSDGEYVLAVGMESRDYATLIRALAATGLPGRLLASSTWAPKGTRMWEGPLPPNVELVERLDYPALRDLYAGARFVVVPLVPSVQAAGSTTAVEAMAMGKAVVASDVAGIRDYVQHGVTGLLVPPTNVPVLAEAITHLWAHSEEAQAMGQAGRRTVEQEMGLDRYVERMASLVVGK